MKRLKLILLITPKTCILFNKLHIKTHTYIKTNFKTKKRTIWYTGSKTDKIGPKNKNRSTTLENIKQNLWNGSRKTIRKNTRNLWMTNSKRWFSKQREAKVRKRIQSMKNWSNDSAKSFRSRRKNYQDKQVDCFIQLDKFVLLSRRTSD